MVDEQAIKARIEELKAEQERFVHEANRQLFAYNAIIKELERLLNPLAASGAPEAQPASPGAGASPDKK